MAEKKKRRTAAEKAFDERVERLQQKAVNGWQIPMNHETFSAIHNAAVEAAKANMDDAAVIAAVEAVLATVATKSSI